MDEARVHQAVADALRVSGVPRRLEILRTIAAGGPLSPSVFGRDSGTPLRESAYHFRFLRDAGLLVLARVELSSGTAQHFYDLGPVARGIVEALPALERAVAAQQRAAA
jgi:DNA-binding transcriptional ArsR family regulator